MCSAVADARHLAARWGGRDIAWSCATLVPNGPRGCLCTAVVVLWRAARCTPCPCRSALPAPRWSKDVRTHASDVKHPRRRRRGCFTSLACVRTSLLHRGAGSAERQGQGVQRAARHSTTTAVHRHPRGPLGTSVAQDQAMSRPPHRAARWRASATAEHTNHVCTAWLGACCVHACASAR